MSVAPTASYSTIVGAEGHSSASRFDTRSTTARVSKRGTPVEGPGRRVEGPRTSCPTLDLADGLFARQNGPYRRLRGRYAAADSVKRRLDALARAAVEVLRR